MPQEDDVVTPPVALGDTEHGPCGMNAGLVSFWPPEVAAPGVTVGDSETLGVALEGLPRWALAGPNAASPKMTARMKWRFIALSIP